MLRKPYLIGLLISLILFNILCLGCGATDKNFKWQSQDRVEDPWKVNVTADCITEKNKQTLVFSVIVTNTSSDYVKNINVQVVFPDNWPISQSSTGWIGSTDFKANEVIGFSFKETYSFNDTPPLIQKDVKNLTVRISGQNRTSVFKFD